MFLLTVRLYPCFCLPRVGNRLGRAGGRCLGGSGRKPGTAPSLLASHVARVPVWDGTAVLLTTAINRLRRQVNRSPLDRLSATPTRYQYQHQDQSESQSPVPVQRSPSTPFDPETPLSIQYSTTCTQWCTLHHCASLASLGHAAVQNSAVVGNVEAGAPANR